MARFTTSQQDIGATEEAIEHVADGASLTYIKAKAANAGIIYLGVAGVTASNGFPLSPGETHVVSAGTLDGLFAIAASAGDDLTFFSDFSE